MTQASLKTGWRLGHFQGRDGSDRHYHTQPLPDRPTADSRSHSITCGVCGAELSIEIMSPDMVRARRAGKLLPGILTALTGIILAFWAANQPNDPETFEYPAWQTPIVFLGVAVVIAGLCLIAFGSRETGVRIHPRALRTRNTHWIVR